MKISVVIIAHNEEKYIGQCIESVLNQTQKPDEVILVVHNSTDRTLDIAQKYPIVVIPFNGVSGSVAPRCEAFRHVSGDIIICTDGDSYVKHNWVEVMSQTLQKNNILVGSFIKFKGTVLGSLANILNKYRCVSQNEKSAVWIWGPSFAFWGRDKDIVSDILRESVIKTKQLGLTRNPDDYFMALGMSKRGGLEVTNKTYVTQYLKEQSSREMFARTKENIENGIKMRDAFIVK